MILRSIMGASGNMITFYALQVTYLDNTKQIVLIHLLTSYYAVIFLTQSFSFWSFWKFLSIWTRLYIEH